VPVIFEPLAHEAIAERRTQIEDHYEARKKALDERGVGDSVPYKPVPPDALYLSPEKLDAAAGERLAVDLSPFDQPDVSGTKSLSRQKPGRAQLCPGTRRPVAKCV
jgi:transcription-repair coupling factor (superfamily II helicase)